MKKTLYGGINIAGVSFVSDARSIGAREEVCFVWMQGRYKPWGRVCVCDVIRHFEREMGIGEELNEEETVVVLYLYLSLEI